MEIIPYLSHQPRDAGSFIERNPNLSYLLVYGESSVIIDAGYIPEHAIRDLKQKQVTPEYILITHNHGDHISSLRELVAYFPEVKIGIHPFSADSLSQQGFKNVVSLKDDMVLTLGGDAISVVHTPGHTADSISFWDKKNEAFFSGDTIFGGGIGCADYYNSGNRNIFYQTIAGLQYKLAASTRLFPGHWSEHHKTMPPYLFSAEISKNPYVRNAKNGERGKFDSDLKEFSKEFELNDYIMLHEADIERSLALEHAVWVPELQATRETILNRMRLGHHLLAVKDGNELVGMVAWRYSDFSITDSPDKFPRKFANFANDPSCNESPKSAFIYSVGVRPANRRGGTGSYLLQQVFEKMKADGVAQVFIDGRLPSYNGSQQVPYEVIKPNAEFKAAVDRYFTENRFPSLAEFSLDPDIRFYLKNGAKPWLILKNFISDQHSGNIRIICYINLLQENFGYKMPE